MSSADELRQALQKVYAEHLRVSRILERRDEVELERLAAAQERVAKLEAEHGALQARLEFHQRELSRLNENPRPAITLETLARLSSVSFVVTAAALGLSSSGSTLLGLTGVAAVLALLAGYLRG